MLEGQFAEPLIYETNLLDAITDDLDFNYREVSHIMKTVKIFFKVYKSKLAEYPGFRDLLSRDEREVFDFYELKLNQYGHLINRIRD